MTGEINSPDCYYIINGGGSIFIFSIKFNRGFDMSISALGASNAAALLQQTKVSAQDGDSPAVEAAESAATKRAENQNGGFVSKSVAAGSGSGLIDKLV